MADLCAVPRAVKGKVNEKLRTLRGEENCIDFEKALRSDKNPYAFKEGFDSGDHLHPSEDAYRTMAELAFSVLNKNNNI